MKLMLVLGARPQIIKSAPLIREASRKLEIELQIVHTGQHYDFEMSKIFFDELGLPSPLVDLGVGSGSHAWQTGRMMIGLEKAMLKLEHDLVLVQLVWLDRYALPLYVFLGGFVYLLMLRFLKVVNEGDMHLLRQFALNVFVVWWIWLRGFLV